ncbi:TonB-dependent receptor [Seongchinamella unica]|uniref:TonB-dependent receptor n=1 Tax=Seongchinamella unica TaxID=2547392 RepID=A0A4R5LVX6_9GAMM|nr:TonB-dependent receptor [Seongchinamella unica]TDG15527.1 TonB-dependent receptor [Seongchinamella unica]
MKPCTARTPLFAAVAFASAMSSPTLVAQTDEPGFALEEVVVTARRRSESLQDVPIAVTAFSARDLAIRGDSDITELAQSVPSVTLEPSRATSSTLTAFIRGVGQQDPLAGYEQGVGLYLDDVYLARPQGNVIDIYDVERIEVLRGPQGTLYGRNTVGGAIKYITRRLGDEFSGRLKATYGEYDQIDLVGTVSVPVSDAFRIGGTVASFQRDGYGENKTTGDEHYNKDVFAYRLSAEWLPTEDLLVRLAYDDTTDKSNPVAGHRVRPGAVSGDPVLRDIYDTTAGAAENISTQGIGGNNEVEAEGWMVSVDWNFGDHYTFRSITAEREDYTESVIDFDSLAVDDFDAPVIYDNEQFTQEFQLLYNGEKMNLVTGLYYIDADASNDFDVVLGQLGRAAYGAELTAYTGGKVTTESWSAFADLTWNFTDKLSVAVGGRYTDDKRTADVLRASYLGAGGSPFFGNDDALFLGASSDYQAEESWTDFSPRVNISYLWTDDITVYGGYSQGFKAGMFDPRGANFLTPAVEEGVDPETLDSYEVGIKASYWDGRAITNVALFYSEYTDMQVPGSVGIDTDGDGINDDFAGTLTNAGEAEISGIEIEGTFLFTENFSMQVAASFLDAEITEWIVNDVDVSDDRSVQNTPEEMAYVAFNYLTGAFGGDLNLNANWSYRGDSTQFEFAAPVFDQEAYDMFNASVVWVSASEAWLLGLYGKNLSDEEIKTAGYCFGNESYCSPLGFEDNTSIFYAAPRTISATVAYRF